MRSVAAELIRLCFINFEKCLHDLETFVCWKYTSLVESEVSLHVEVDNLCPITVWSKLSSNFMTKHLKYWKMWDSLCSLHDGFVRVWQIFSSMSLIFPVWDINIQNVIYRTEQWSVFIFYFSQVKKMYDTNIMQHFYLFSYSSVANSV